MKKLIAIATIFLFISGYTASAQMMGQDDKQNPQQGMMMQRGGMMQGMRGMCPMCGQMMNQDMPMQKYGMMVNHLPSMQQKLSLKDDQVEKLIDLQTDYKKQQIDYQAELQKNQMKLKNILENDASAEQVRNQMNACSETKINMKIAAYETAGQMKNVLTAEQKEKLQNSMMNQGMMQGMQGNRMQGGMMNQQQEDK